MVKKNKQNSGFTLIELIIAMAILAFLMTAVGAMMSSSVLSNRKAQADITVQDAAQLTYNKISDAVLQSKKVFIKGYQLSSGATDPVFNENGKAVSLTYSEFYLAKKEEPKKSSSYNAGLVIAELAQHGVTGVAESNIKFFDEIDPNDKFYVTKMIIYTSEPITGISLPASTTDFSGNSVTVSALSETGLPDQADTVVNIFTFEANKLYLEKKYLFMTSKNDMITNWSSDIDKNRCLYSDAIGYVTSAPDDISGCVVRVDAKNGSIGVDLHFNDKKMTYTSLGMMNVRNSYVLRAKN